eukprot:TRINITY_DN52973_c0_g1_i1.p1 TRINITY_DN52973_c0_g1~~TRINITY_DN52973_c0_g1_i1.p1  ORF type:complete len:575 (+),score=53.20 TRINITY_DN52973_c0_g1_i1:50-1726(+)
MNQVVGSNIQVVKELPLIMRTFAKESRRHKITDEQAFNVFATRYFAKLAGLHVKGHPDLELDDKPKVIHIYRLYQVEEEIPEHDLPSARSNVSKQSGGGDKPELPPNIADGLKLYNSHDAVWRQMEHQVFLEICALRRNPKAYAEKIQELKRYYLDSLANFIVPGGVVLSSAEGWAAYDECVKELQQTQPLPPLDYSTALTIVAIEGLQPEKEQLPARELCNQYGTFSEELGSSVAQSLCFNQLLPQSIILHLLVDDNYDSRGNRRNLLSDEYQQIGVCFHTATCNIVFSSNYTPAQGIQDAGVAPPQEPESYDYSLQLNNKHFQLLTAAEIQEFLDADAERKKAKATDESAKVDTTIDEEPIVLTLIQPPQEVCVVTASAYTFVLNHSCGQLTAALTSLNDVPIADKGCLIQSKDGLAVISTYFPSPGEYRLAVSADLANSAVYTQVLEYNITAHCSPTVSPGFPTTFLQSHGCYIYSPLTSDLAETLTPFVIEVLNQTSGIAVLTEGELYYLQRSEKNPSLWAGLVKLSAGPCKVSTNLDGTHYEIFGFTVAKPEK